jgi:hypothetical protein
VDFHGLSGIMARCNQPEAKSEGRSVAERSSTNRVPRVVADQVATYWNALRTNLQPEWFLFRQIQIPLSVQSGNKQGFCRNDA